VKVKLSLKRLDFRAFASRSGLNLLYN